MVRLHIRLRRLGHRGPRVHHALRCMMRYQCSTLLCCLANRPEWSVSMSTCGHLPQSLCGGDSCSTALICENCSQLSAPSARYALDSVSAVCISLPFVYYTTMSYSNRLSSIHWIRLGALHSGFLTIISRGL